MGRLRNNKPFGKRSYESHSRKPAQIFVIATEGLTENDYFKGFDRNSLPLGIKDRVIVEVLERTDTKSAPKYVKELLDEYKADESVANSDQTPQYVKELLLDEYKESLDEYKIYYGIQPEELWIVIDRDRQSTKEIDLKNTIMDCKNAGYNVALTNPCFEFWLLLHVSDIKQYTPEILFENKRINKSRRFLDKELSRILKGYNKSHLQFKAFLPYLQNAISQAVLFANEIDDIVDNLGTNLHLLVKSILKC